MLVKERVRIGLSEGQRKKGKMKKWFAGLSTGWDISV